MSTDEKETPEERLARLREAGRRGGKATAERYGPEYMSELGKKGFKGLARKLGDNGQAVGYLQDHRAMPRKPRSEWTQNRIWNTDDPL